MFHWISYSVTHGLNNHEVVIVVEHSVATGICTERVCEYMKQDSA